MGTDTLFVSGLFTAVFRSFELFMGVLVLSQSQPTLCIRPMLCAHTKYPFSHMLLIFH